MPELNGLILDVDGVLTDGSMWFGGCTEPMRGFNTQDGFGIVAFQKLGGKVAIITGKESLAVDTRAAELGIKNVVQGSRDKLADAQRLLPNLGVPLEACILVADDLPELPLFPHVGYPIAVANAVQEIRDAAKYVTTRRGGDGAVREAIEHVLRSDGRWARVIADYTPVAT